jgi:hypothetical protein
MLRILAAAILPLTATAAHASDWVLVSRDASGASYLTDRSSYKTVDKYRAAWISVQPGPNAGAAGPNAERIAHYAYFNCAAKLVAMKTGIAYKPDGTVSRTEAVKDSALQWRRIVSNTIGEEHFRRVCSATAATAS